jgi:hypothetical protein
LLVHVPDEARALVAVGDLRLRDELFLELGVAIAGVIVLGAAAVILEELPVGVVDATPLPVLLRPIS